MKALCTARSHDDQSIYGFKFIDAPKAGNIDVVEMHLNAPNMLDCTQKQSDVCTTKNKGGRIHGS